MRITLDPVPLVLGIYPHVGGLLADVAGRREGDDPGALGKKYGRQRQGAADRDLQKLVRTLHAGVKTADKLLKKTGDVWKISRETDLVNLVVQPRGEEPEPRSYVLLRPDDVRAVLGSIRQAAEAAGEDERALDELEEAAGEIKGRAGDYYVFGFDPF